MSDSRQGFDERVGSGRAVPHAAGGDLDDDPSMMVQEQISRIRFFAETVDLVNKSILDLGCGTGFNYTYAKNKLGSGKVLGVDISEASVAYAKRANPNGSFMQGDVCSEHLDCGSEAWDVVLCCEVIEHVNRPEHLLETIYRHLRTTGVALISTPNRPVFSLDVEPSPVNHTHLKEYNLPEFRAMLEQRFTNVQIWGQRFINHRLFEMQQGIVARNIKDYRFLGEWYWADPIRLAWKTLRLEPVHRWLGGGQQYRHEDFSFVTPVSADSIWLCALVTK
ncbi:MAG: class I SAM-dependent methyltransferase [Nitrospira sp.]